MSTRAEGEWVEHEVQDDSGMLYKVTEDKAGNKTAYFRVSGRIALPDGREYDCDRAEVRVRLKRRRD